MESAEEEEEETDEKEEVVSGKTEGVRHELHNCETAMPWCRHRSGKLLDTSETRTTTSIRPEVRVAHISSPHSLAHVVCFVPRDTKQSRGRRRHGRRGPGHR